MKKLFILYVLILSGFIFPLLSFSNDLFLEMRSSYAHLTNHRTSSIYSGGWSLGGELDFQCWQWVYGWVGGDYQYHNGETLGLGTKTTLKVVPLTTGLKGIVNRRGTLRPYWGMGISATYAHVHSESPALIPNNSTWAPGGIFKTGVLIAPWNQFLLDVYIDYLYQIVSFSGKGGTVVGLRHADISSFYFGAALGWGF